MQIQAEERGRRLHITVGDEVELSIRPQNARGGAALLSGFLGIMADLFGERDEAALDLVSLSLGEPVYADPENPTPIELEHKAEAQRLMAILEDLRAEESYTVAQVAFFWQTQGGMAAVRAYLDGGEDGYPKALNILAERTGLAILTEQISTGSSSESASSLTGAPATSTPPSSGA